MSSTFTAYARNQMLVALLDPTSFDPITDLTVALCLQVPAVNAATSDLIEPALSLGYLRVHYDTNVASWGSTGFAEFFNVGDIAFSLATDDWGLITGFAFIDPIVDECVVIGSLATPFIAVAGMTPTLLAGSITLGLYD